MTLDLDRLEQLARAATPGPWQRDPSEDRIVQVGATSSFDSVLNGAPVGDCNSTLMGRDEDIDFIAALSPDVVIALVAELRAARSGVFRGPATVTILRPVFPGDASGKAVIAATHDVEPGGEVSIAPRTAEQGVWTERR